MELSLYLCLALVWFAATLLFILGIDDLFIDLVYWGSRFKQLFFPEKPPVTEESLLKTAEKPIALLIPCWHEDQVIRSMVGHTLEILRYKNYDLFIGVYPNDLPTVAAAEALAATDSRVKVLRNVREGPTTKGDNLNNMIHQIEQLELESGRRYEIFAFCDAEDVVHPLVLKLFNCLMPAHSMVQLPVMALPSKWSEWTHWTYCDTFAENHFKDMIVRKKLGNFIPMAGTGMALSRSCVHLLRSENSSDQLFDSHMLTEDYDTGLRIYQLKLSEIYALQQASDLFPNEEKRVDSSKREKAHQEAADHSPTDEFIGIREFFPKSYRAAVRQRSRWIFGIIFQEWSKPWEFVSWKVLLAFYHDRKGIISYFAAFLGSAILFFLLLHYFWGWFPALAAAMQTPALRPLLIANLFIMANRMLQKFIAVRRLYGTWQGLVSIPRMPYDSLINVHALALAYRTFLSYKQDRQVTWEKTEHEFPSSRKSA